MSNRTITAFERRLRMLIGSGRLDNAEQLIRVYAAIAREDKVLAALDRSGDGFAIDDWRSIGADLVESEMRLARQQSGAEVQAIVFGLLNTTRTAPTVTINFSLSTEPDPDVMRLRLEPFGQHDQERWRRELQTQVVSPPTLRGACRYEGGIRLSGFDELYALQSEHETIGRSADQRHCRQTLASAAILLRYHALIERYVRDAGLPRAMPAFVGVQSVEWPFESNIYVYGTSATRRIDAAGATLDAADAQSIVDQRRRSREEFERNETRRVISEMREIHEALALWPWWRNPIERARFAMTAEATLKRVRDGIGRRLGIDASAASGEDLYRLVAQSRHDGKDDIDALLEHLPPSERSSLHDNEIAFAKRFGGPNVRSFFVSRPDQPGIIEDIY